jgi:hypothetical protein
LTLTLEQEPLACDFICEESQTGNFVTQSELLNCMEERFHVTLTHGWISTILSRHSEKVGRAFVSPQELPRLQTPQCYFDKYIDLIQACVPLVPSELIFNLDESGLSDWEERKSKAVLVKTKAADQPLHYPVDRGIRHHTLLRGISASGDAYCPLLLSPSREVLGIYEKGARENIDLQRKIVDSPYVTREIFIEYVRRILIPAVESNRLFCMTPVPVRGHRLRIHNAEPLRMFVCRLPKTNGQSYAAVTLFWRVGFFSTDSVHVSRRYDFIIFTVYMFSMSIEFLVDGVEGLEELL